LRVWRDPGHAPGLTVLAITGARSHVATVVPRCPGNETDRGADRPGCTVCRGSSWVTQRALCPD
jgi:hypothetical protein